MTLTVGSLFAGVGGFDIAAERAGMTVLWQSEVDKKASVVLEHYWPGLNLGDIHGLTIDSDPNQFAPPPGIVRRIAAVDVLCGGFPCQDYSIAGHREGLAGDRGALWWEYHRLITEGRPTWVVAENVPGLLSSRDGQDFATIIDSLTELGYGVVWGVLDAQYNNVAQRRRRVFIVGHSGGRPRPEVLALSEGVFGYPEPSRETRQGVAGRSAICSNGTGVTGSVTTAFDAKNYSNHQEVNAGSLVVAFAQNQRDEVRDLGDVAGALASQPGMKQQTYVVHATQDPDVTEDMVAPSGATNHQAVIGFGSKDYGADASVDVAPTLRAGNHVGSHLNGGVPPAIATTATVRRLTPLETERLQGFPDGWTDIPGNSDSQRYKQMGNAVAVPVVEWIMKRIADVER